MTALEATDTPRAVRANSAYAIAVSAAELERPLRLPPAFGPRVDDGRRRVP
jgi:hypothetical protein